MTPPPDRVDVVQSVTIACTPREFLEFVMDIERYAQVDDEIAPILWTRRQGNVVTFACRPRLAGLRQPKVVQTMRLTPGERIDIALTPRPANRLSLLDVTLVLNDWGGGQFLLTERFPGHERVARLALVACEAFDNMPPGPAKTISRVAAVPGGVWLLLQLLRVRAIRRHPDAYGGMSVRGLPDDVLTEWLRPARGSRAIRRDFAKFATGTLPRDVLLACSKRLADVDLPGLIVWANDDGGQIVGVEPRMAPVPDGCPVRVPDGMLLPGLIDAHAHHLRAGVTTVRDLGDWRDAVLAWRAGAARDLPSVVASGTPITSTGGHCWALGDEAAGEGALRAAVQQRAEAGADVVKIMASGGVFTPGTDTTRPQFTDAEVAAAVTEAHALGLPITAHAHALTAVVQAARACMPPTYGSSRARTAVSAPPSRTACCLARLTNTSGPASQHQPRSPRPHQSPPTPAA